METAFEIIAEPNRRAILSLLMSSQQSVGDIERRLRMTQPTVSKHLRVLREAGFVEATADAQRRLYRLKPEPFQELDMWLAQFRRFWSGHVIYQYIYKSRDFMRECIKFYYMAYSIMRIEILLSHIRDKNKFKSEGFLFTLVQCFKTNFCYILYSIF